MDCWSQLGLTTHAGVRDIKRQYARLLKDTRPDDDPLGFQRLREAYEQALARAQRREQHVEEEGVAVTPGVPDSLSEPLLAMERDVEMPETFSPEAFQHSLERAEAQGRRERFEQRLLYLLLDASEEDLGAVYWAMERLHWYSPWQPAHLPQEDLNRLAERLLIGRLRFVHSQLCAGDEKASLQMIRALGEEGWLSSLDRRDWFQQRLAEMLVEAPGWSHLFFEQVCRIYGWSDEVDLLPFSEDLWRRLFSRTEEDAWVDRLLEAADGEPVTSEQKAAKFLFKAMSPARRRQMVDSFGQDEWRQCHRLSDLLPTRFPELYERLVTSRLANWQQWQPRDSWLGLYVLIWMSGLFCYLGYSQGKPYANLMARLGEGVFIFFLSILFMITLVPWLAEEWRVFGCRWAWPDTWVSSKLIPKCWFRGGAGILLVRHVLPCAICGVCIWLLTRGLMPSYMAVAGGISFPTIALVYLNWMLSGPLLAAPWRDLLCRLEGLRPSRWLNRGILMLLIPLVLYSASFMAKTSEVHRTSVTPKAIIDACRIVAAKRPAETQTKSLQDCIEGVNRIRNSDAPSR